MLRIVTIIVLLATAATEIRLGNVLFENVTDAYGIRRFTPTFGCACYDANQDGWPDLLISNHGNPPMVFLNRKGVAFTEAPLLPVKSVDLHAPAVADYDNDGDQDLYFSRGAHQGKGLGPNELYVNPGNGKPFTFVRNETIADPSGRGRAGVWFDYDRDGLLDLLVINRLRRDAPNRLFRNEGNGTFTDVSAKSGMDLFTDSDGGAEAGDLDNDGDMDVVITSLGRRRGLHLMINMGNGTFKDLSAKRGIPLTGKIWAVGMEDYNDDGFLDLYLSGGGYYEVDGALLTENELHFVQSVGEGKDRMDTLTFTADANAVLKFEFPKPEPTFSRNIHIGAAGRRPPFVEFTVGPGAIDPVGRPSDWKSDTSGIFIWKEKNSERWTISTAGANKLDSGGRVTTQSHLKNLQMIDMENVPPNLPDYLLLNNKDGAFSDVTGLSGMRDSTNSRSALWADFDNDTDKDLLIVNAGFSGTGKQENSLYLNQDRKFELHPIPMEASEKLGRGDAGAIADFNHDGKLDLFLINGLGLLPANRGPYQLLLNRTTNSNRWIRFRLVGGGHKYTNRDAIGAKINIKTADGKSYWRYLPGGSGSVCQSESVLHFGLGSMSQSLEAIVYWPPGIAQPKGHKQTFRFAASDFNRTHVINETSSAGVSPAVVAPASRRQASYRE